MYRFLTKIAAEHHKCTEDFTMKRLDPEDKIALLKLEKRRAHNWAVRMEKKKKAEARLVIQSREHLAFATQHHVRHAKDLTRLPILLPIKLSLRDNYDETVAAITELRQRVLIDRQPVTLYFDKVEELEPAATLMLIAEIYRCRNLRPGRGNLKVTGNYPKSNNVFLQLREMGFYQIIGVDERIDIPDVREQGSRPYFIRFRTYKGVDPEFAAAFCQMTMTGTFKMTEVALGRMVGALKEAMGNSLEHAYALPNIFPAMSGRWWVTGYIDPIQHEMMITFFDQGVGVPRRLGPDMFDRIKSTISQLNWSPSDGHMIAAATELHRTSTLLGGRGKGFRDMKKFIDTCDDGELRVISDKGCYCYTRKDTHISDSDRSIGGTLIEWRVRHASTLEVE